MRGAPTPRTTRALRAGLALFAVIALLALATPTSAQVTPFDVAFSSTSRASQTSTDGACLTYSAVVENTGSSPVPPEHQIDLSLSAAPSGWRVQPALNPTTLTLAPGATGQVSFGLCPAADLADEDSAQVTLTAVVASDPQNPQASATTTFTARVQSDDLFGLALPDSFLWILLGAVAVLTAIVLLTRRRPQAGIAVACPEPAKEVLAGRGTSFPIRIQNEGRDKDIVTLGTSPVPRGWDTFLPLVDIPLEGREEQTVWLSVKSPENARPGDRVVVKVMARSSSSGAEQAAIDTLTTVRAEEASEVALDQDALTESAPDATGERSVYGREDEPAEEKPVAVKRKKRS